MRELMFAAEGTPEEVIDKVIADLGKVLLQKREVAKWKIKAVRDAFKKLGLAQNLENADLP